MTSRHKKQVLTRTKTLNFLENLSKDTGDTLQTLYLPPNLPTIELKNILKELPCSTTTNEELVDLYFSSLTGVVIFWNTEQKYLIVPPFPITERRIIPSLDTTYIQSQLKNDYYIGIILVRLGSYAIGICHGDKLLNIKIGTGLIHGRHRQGGSSAHRFERHRDKQIESFLIRVCGHIREQLEPYIKSIDYMVYGGARTTILMLQKYCPLLGRLNKPTLPPLLNIPEPRRAVLEIVVSRIWSSVIYDFTGD